MFNDQARCTRLVFIVVDLSSRPRRHITGGAISDAAASVVKLLSRDWIWSLIHERLQRSFRLKRRRERERRVQLNAELLTVRLRLHDPSPELRYRGPFACPERLLREV